MILYMSTLSIHRCRRAVYNFRIPPSSSWIHQLRDSYSNLGGRQHCTGAPTTCTTARINMAVAMAWNYLVPCMKDHATPQPLELESTRLLVHSPFIACIEVATFCVILIRSITIFVYMHSVHKSFGVFRKPPRYCHWHA